MLAFNMVPSSSPRCSISNPAVHQYTWESSVVCSYPWALAATWEMWRKLLTPGFSCLGSEAADGRSLSTLHIHTSSSAFQTNASLKNNHKCSDGKQRGALAMSRSFSIARLPGCALASCKVKCWEHVFVVCPVRLHGTALDVTRALTLAPHLACHDCICWKCLDET